MIWLELVAFVVLLGFSAFFSSSETSLFSLSTLQLEQMRRDDNPHIDLIERLLSEPRRLIVTILIGNEFVNVAASVISAALIIELLGAESKFLNLLVMVPILLLVGEITPKTLAIRNNVAFATWQSRPISVFAALIKPLRLIIRALAEWIITRIVGKERTRGNIITEDMVRALAHEAVGEGALDRSEAQYIEQIFEFGDKTVGQLMTSRSNVFFLPVDMPLDEILSEVRRTRHTKIPVYRDHRDQIVGVLYPRDLLGVDFENAPADPDFLLRLLRQPYFVPESKSAGDLFRTFCTRHLSLAIAVDEFGGITGLITMEDLLECIFGEIPSASDLGADAGFEKLSDGAVLVDAAMEVDDFNETFQTQIDTTMSETVGGLVLQTLGELPQAGAKATLSDVEFTVESVAHNRVTRLSVRRTDEERQADSAEESTRGDGAETGGEDPGAIGPSAEDR